MEGVGFEPTVRLWRTHAFQACSLSHSDIPPKKRYRIGIRESFQENYQI